MRILNVSAQKPDGTGSGTYLCRTVEAQLAAGHEAAVVCGVDDGDLGDEGVPAGIPRGVAAFPVLFMTPDLPFHVCGMSDEMPYPATRYRDLTPGMATAFEETFRRRVIEAAREFRPDAVICHHLYLLAAIVSEALPELPVFGVCHSTDLRQMASHGLGRERIKAGVRGLDGVFALHEAQADLIASTYGCDPSRIAVVGTGYDPKVFNRGGDGRPVPDRVPGRICYVGKVSAKKGVGSLVAALDLLGPADVPAPLSLDVVGGHDPAAADYERIREQARACRWPVRLRGRLGIDELADAYRACDVFVLPSFYEGLPLVGIEALACGAKAVMTAVPGVREAYEGLLPGNRVRWVELPSMRSVDEPEPSALPAFERRLADAIASELAAPRRAQDTSGASWRRVSDRMLSRVAAALP